MSRGRSRTPAEHQVVQEAASAAEAARALPHRWYAVVWRRWVDTHPLAQSVPSTPRSRLPGAWDPPRGPQTPEERRVWQILQRVMAVAIAQRRSVPWMQVLQILRDEQIHRDPEVEDA